MKKSVLVTVPTGDAWIHKHVVFALFRLKNDLRYDVRIMLPTWSPYENNLHHIVAEWIGERDEDYWLNIDSDNPPLRNPLELIAYDKDIIGLPTPVWHYKDKPGERPIYWNAYRKVGDKEGYTEWMPREGFQKVDAVGTGCVLFARRVFEDLEMQKGPFVRKLQSNGIIDRGNDISFCERATERGFEIWAHFDYMCMHFNELELTEVVRAFKGLGVK